MQLPPRALVVPIARGSVQRGPIPTIRVDPYATALTTPPCAPPIWLAVALDCAGAFVGER